MSAHDSTIESSYSDLLSQACLREYEHLEHYFCLGCNPLMFDFVQWYDADTKANCAVGGPNCEFKRFDKGTSTDWRDVAKDGKYGMLRVCDTFLDSLLFSGGECQAQSNSSSCVVDRYDNCGLVISGQGVLPSAYFVDDNGRPDYLKFIDVIRPPYFSTADFDISVEYLRDEQSIEGGQYYYEPWDNDGICFSGSIRLLTSTLALAISAFASLLLTTQ